MAVLGRVLIGSQERLDLADFLALDSYTAGDFKHLIKSFVGTQPMILKGFDIIDAPLAVGTTSVSVRVADSILYHSESSAGSFFSGLPEGDALSQPLVPELRLNATNFVYLTLSSVGQAPDNRAYWDVDLNGGEGGEFNQDTNTESVLIAQVGVSVSTFPDGTIPVAKVVMDATTITKITDCRNMMFRLGSGGTNPDPNNKYSFRELPSIAYTRNEPAISITSSAAPNPFYGGDKNIYSMKEWMDVVMTKLLELSGTTFWYESSAAMSVADIFADALGSSIKSKGKWSHDLSTPGKVTWSEDILYRKMNDPREVIIRSNAVTGVTLSDDEIMWIEMLRAGELNSLDSPVNWSNGDAFVNGSIGSFENLSKGDWVKKYGDNDTLFLRVEDFKDTAGGIGSSTTAANALSINLSGPYTGSTSSDPGVYTKGEYTNSDIQVSTRDDAATFAAGGNFYWLANRSDTIQAVDDITATMFTSNVDISDSDGVRAKLTFPTPHGLVDGDRVVVAGAGAYNGTYQVEVEDSDIAIINTTATTNPSNVTVSWSIVTTTSRDNGYGYQLESANHNFESNQTIVIANTGSAYDTYQSGLYQINARSATTFQIPYDTDTDIPSPPANATASCARVNLKTEFGAVKVIQGESIDVNEPESQNILSYIGMDSLSQTSPVYALPTGYNTLAGFQNFNSDPDDSLTKRISQLTAMMADRVQDRSLRISGRVTFKNETTGSNQIVTAYGPITIEKHGSPQQIVSLANFSLAVNQALVATVSRDASTVIVPVAESLYSPFLLEENKLILFYRLSGTSVYSWDGHEIPNSGGWTVNDYETSQNRNVSILDKAGVFRNSTTGVIGFNSTAENVYIQIPGAPSLNTIDAATIDGLAYVMPINKVAWIRINRQVSKTFNNFNTSPTWQDDDTTGTIYITDRDEVPTDQDVFVIYMTNGADFITQHHVTPKGEIYEETKEILAPVVAPDDILLPTDSRRGGETRNYIVGTGQLTVYLNGQKLEIGASNDYTEGTGVEVYGDATAYIKIRQNLVVGDRLTFRIDSNGATYFSPIVTTTTLQQAYDNGPTITTTALNGPVTIGGLATPKVLVVNGDMDVTGVIDPTGLTFTPQVSNPISSHYGLWVDDATKDLKFHNAGGITAAINISQDFVRRDGVGAAPTADVSWGGFKITNLADPTAAQEAATKAYVDSTATSTTAIRRDGTQPPTTDISWGGFKITNLADPTAAQEAATKAYVDSGTTSYIRRDGTLAATADIPFGGFKLTGVGTPTAGADATTKTYVDNLSAPVGAIVAYNPGYYTSSANAGFTFVGVGANTVAAVNAFLPANWRVCNGAALNDAGSPIFNGANRYLPNLTDDRFLRGDTAAGAVGGAASVVPTGSFTGDPIAKTTWFKSGNFVHSHLFSHTHAWGFMDNQSGGNGELRSKTSASVISTTMTAADVLVMDTHNVGDSGVPVPAYRHGGGADSTLYTAGPILAPSGSGATATTDSEAVAYSTWANATVGQTNYTPTGSIDINSTSIMPTYLNTFYIMRVK